MKRVFDIVGSIIGLVVFAPIELARDRRSTKRIGHLGKNGRHIWLTDHPGPQLNVLTFWKVLIGELSLVGPTAPTPEQFAQFSASEKQLLRVRPGIACLGAVVFIDEQEMLERCDRPEHEYEKKILPWKNQLDLLYLGRQSLWLDAYVIWLFAVNWVSQDMALNSLVRKLHQWGADAKVIAVATRQQELQTHSRAATTEGTRV